jgi:hypothetical protein
VLLHGLARGLGGLVRGRLEVDVGVVVVVDIAVMMIGVAVIVMMIGVAVIVVIGGAVLGLVVLALDGDALVLVLTDSVMVMPEQLVHPHVHVRHDLEPEDPHQARQRGKQPSRGMSRIPHRSKARASYPQGPYGARRRLDRPRASTTVGDEG